MFGKANEGALPILLGFQSVINNTDTKKSSSKKCGIIGNANMHHVNYIILGFKKKNAFATKSSGTVHSWSAYWNRIFCWKM